MSEIQNPFHVFDGLVREELNAARSVEAREWHGRAAQAAALPKSLPLAASSTGSDADDESSHTVVPLDQPPADAYAVDYRVSPQLAYHDLNYLGLMRQPPLAYGDPLGDLTERSRLVAMLWKYESNPARDAVREIATAQGRADGDELALRVDDRREATSRVIDCRVIASEVQKLRRERRVVEAPPPRHARKFARAHLRRAVGEERAGADAAAERALEDVYVALYQSFSDPPDPRYTRNLYGEHKAFAVGVERCLLSGRVGQYLGYARGQCREYGVEYPAAQHVFLSCGRADGAACPPGTLLCQHGHTSAEIAEWCKSERRRPTSKRGRPTDFVGKRAGISECREGCWAELGLRWPKRMAVDPRPPTVLHSFWDVLARDTPAETIRLLDVGGAVLDEPVVAHEYFPWVPWRPKGRCRWLKEKETPINSGCFYVPSVSAVVSVDLRTMTELEHASPPYPHAMT